MMTRREQTCDEAAGGTEAEGKDDDEEQRKWRQIGRGISRTTSLWPAQQGQSEGLKQGYNLQSATIGTLCL